MADRITVLLHANLDYAEFPRTEANNIVKMSYIPMIDHLLQHDLGPVLLNITGHTLEYLRTHHMELVNQIKQLIETDRIELVGSAYSHPILPLLPKWRRIAQLESHKQVIEDQFDIQLRGFWPPEEAISPIIVDEIVEAGYEWICADHEHINIAQSHHNDQDPFSNRENTITETLVKAFWSKWYQVPRRYFKAYRVANKWVDRYDQPFVSLKNMAKPVNVMLTSVAWTNITIFALQHTPPFYSKSKLKKMIRKSTLPILPIYTSDLEFFGYRSHTGNAPTPMEFVSFLSEVAEEGVVLETPSKIQNQFEASTYKITAGSWAPDKSLRIWTESEDNQELTRRMTEIYTQLSHIKPVLKETEFSEIKQLLRVAENSDARGWSPINERKHEAYTAIFKLYQLLST